MTSLSVETLRLPIAPVGPSSVLPPLRERARVHDGLDLRQAEEALGPQVSYGWTASILPYTMQRAYGRDRATGETTVAVLENDLLRAVFLLEAGGRLWSLIHRPTGRELLASNAVLQPANLAIRGAWFAGGVEWNIGTIGHSPLTASPVHAAVVSAPDDSPVLRLYEWERLRDVVFQLDVMLPDDSPVLLVAPRIRNHHDDDLPMYWWSNIAVPERDDVRVLVPATSAWTFTDDHQISLADVPDSASSAPDPDCTYPARSARSADWFFRMPPGQRPWIAAVDGAGFGLAQVSTAMLTGRKLFSWGNRPGGRHWQQWLSGGTGTYFEIQAGLAPTQLQHVRMAAHSHCSWVEAYGPLRVDPLLAHGANWTAAVAVADSAVAELVPPAQWEKWTAILDGLADQAPGEQLFAGSGWGALERIRRGTSDGDLRATPFPGASLGPEQQDWLELLAGKPLPRRQPQSYVAGPHWLRLLEETPPSWSSLLHLGVARYAAGDVAGAHAAWTASVADQPNPIALRSVGILALLDGRAADAATLLRQAYDLARNADDSQAGDRGGRARTSSLVYEILLELLDALLASDQPRAALAAIDATPAAWRPDGRLQLYEARAALAAGDLDRCARILDSSVVIPDAREGEITFERVWQELASRRGPGAAARPVPAIYDFRA